MMHWLRNVSYWRNYYLHRLTKIIENHIELLAIERLQALGYQYIHGQDIAPDGEFPERDSFEQVLLLGRLTKAIRKINPSIPLDVQQEAIKELLRISSSDLLNNNESFH